MKTSYLLIFLSFISVTFGQTKTNILDENVNTNIQTVIFERIDGSVFEKNGKTNWTVHRLLPSSNDFSKFVKAKRPIAIEYETIDGKKYSNTNGANWQKEERRFVNQTLLGFTANYKNQQKIIEAMFTITEQAIVEINLHSVFGETVITLYNNLQQTGQHNLQFSVQNVPNGEYMLVLRTPQKVESVRLSIFN
jgi:hypothetical protein